MINIRTGRYNKKFLVKAAEQALNEVLGYDEGRAYYLLLIKKDEELEKEFSYSKKYRLMKSLFEFGAMAKIKPGDKDFYSYIILPPCFLYKEKVDKEIIEFLEKIYLENYSNILNTNFSQLILKDEKILLVFLLKYFMKDEARLIIGSERFDMIENKNITFIKEKENKRRLGVIDKNFAFDFVSVMNKEGYDSVGYIAHNGKEEKNKKDYISSVEKQLEGFS